MTAKEYLQQAFFAIKQIDYLKSQIAELNSLIGSVQSPRWDTVNVQSSTISDPVVSQVELLAKIADRANKLNAKLAHYIDVKANIQQSIDSLQNPTHRELLQKRYLEFKKWEQIAVEMHYTYKWVHVLHGRALEVISY